MKCGKISPSVPEFWCWITTRSSFLQIITISCYKLTFISRLILGLCSSTHKYVINGSEVAAALTFHHLCLPNLKKVPQGVSEIWRPQECDRRTNENRAPLASATTSKEVYTAVFSFVTLTFNSLRSELSGEDNSSVPGRLFLELPRVGRCSQELKVIVKIYFTNLVQKLTCVPRLVNTWNVFELIKMNLIII